MPVFSSFLSASSLAPTTGTAERSNRGSFSRIKTTSTQSLSASGPSTRRPSSPSGLAAAEYISDEDHIRQASPEAPDLRDLNTSLEALAIVFPDVQIEVFREMLSSFDGESRLALAADALLRNRVTWVKGRWRVADKENRTDKLAPAEVFRAPEYKTAVQALAAHEFRGLSRSAINAVLAEQNYSYLEARRALVLLSSKSWRFTLSSLLLRRKPVTCGDNENHPLIIWRSSGQGSIIPCLKSTGNAELDRELFDELIAPLKARSRVAQEEKDRVLATMLNTEEAEAEEATHDCECCFTTATFEEFTTCNADGHMICFRCVQHSLSEAVFGQGWHRSIDTESGTLRCPAVDAEECTGRIAADHIHRAMLEEKKGAEVLHQLEQRLAEHSLLKSNMPLVRCPFCSYAEVDDVYLAPTESGMRLRLDNIYTLIVSLGILLVLMPVLVPTLGFSSILALVLSSHTPFGVSIRAETRAALARSRRRRRGLKFTCASPRCGRTSCLACEKEWTDIHVCHESSLVALRTQVEQAMSMAVKRVCPRCHTSFVKTAGCNKLTCPCGYKMCYVCRKDIGGENDGGNNNNNNDDVGYRHFCQHFRPEGDPRACNECNKCNLWESEDTEGVLRAAKEEAEAKWREMERRELSGAERAFLETGVAARKGAAEGGGLESILCWRGRLPSVPEVFDLVVDGLFV